MSLRTVILPSLADDLDEFVPWRDRSPMPVLTLPPPEVLHQQLSVGCPCKKAGRRRRCASCLRAEK